MKNFYKKTIFVFVFAINFIFSAFSQSATTSTTIYYSGFQACGGCAVCGADYWCTNTPLSYCGNTAPIIEKTFFDPVPAGSIITNVTVNYWTASCQGAAIYGTFATSSTTSFVFPVAYDGNGGCLCSSNPCVLTTSASVSYPCGIPGYVYGGTNIFRLSSSEPMCINRAQLVFTYYPASTLVPSISASGPLVICSGVGSVVLTVNNGFSGYLWNTGAASQAITVTSAGTYTVTVTSTSGCNTLTASIIVANGTTPAASASSGTYCDGQSATISALPLGMTYNWSGPNSMTGGLQSFTGTASSSIAGTYYVTVTNAEGCTSTASTVLTVNPNNVTPIFTALGPYCVGATPGSLPTSSTNTPAITGTWSPATISTATVGTTVYNFTPAANQCGATTTMSVTINASPTVTVNSPAICSGANATVTATPAPAGSYTYAWTVPGGATNPGNTSSTSTNVAGTYTVTITNGSGCTSSSSGTVTINTSPTVTVNSPAICSGANATVTATPAPAGSYTYAWTVPGGATNPGNTSSTSTNVAGTYTVTITNGSGCTSSSSGAVTINANPTVTVNSPSVCSGTNVTVTATPAPAGSYTYAWTVPGGATDPGNTSSTSTNVSGTYTVTITNGSGCTSSSSGTLVVNPNITPTFTALGPYCNGDSPASLPTTSNNGFTGTWSPATITTGSAGSIVYTLTPDAGQCATTASITVVTNNCCPTITCPSNVDISACNQPIPSGANSPASFNALDGVSNTDGTSISYSDATNTVGCTATTTRTYTANNTNGTCPVTCQQIITRHVDAVNPTASNPAPITVQCASLVPASNVNVVTDEADNCSVPTVTFVSDVSNGATCPEIITRTYKVEDACSNFINVTQTITVGDNISPTASNPATIAIQCSGLVPAVDISVVTDEADNCSVPTVTFVSDVSNGATCPEIITRTYSVTDACGNSINVTQTITVGDNISPTASNPSTIAVQCSGLVPAVDISVVNDEADNCSVPTVTFVSDVSNGATCPETVTRTYRVADACNNFINVIQTITVGDNVQPTASNPVPIAVQCASLVPAADVNVVTDEADNCSVPVVTFISDVSNGASCPEIITRTYKVTDACNNFINIMQTITVGDNIPPTASNPATITVQCASLVPTSNVNVVTDEADNCSVPTVTFVSDVSNGATCPEIITRTYKVADACNNFINVTQTITVGDNIPPTASNPSPIAVQCASLVPLANVNVVTDEADNCSTPTVAFVSDVSNGATCPEIITRTYSVTDACGNSINVTQTITIGDNISPTASNPSTIAVQCSGLVPAVDISVVNDEADNCSVPTVTFVSDVSNGATCPETVTRTYKVADACNNFINVTQIITVGDNIPPTASNPAPLSVQCASSVPFADISVVTDATDNCTVPTVTFVSDVSNGATCPEIITRTYKVTDACNNFINVTQTVTVGDNIPPVITGCPSGQTLCQVAAGNYTIPQITATDNCTANPSIAYSITGATNRTGVGGDASGLFSVGTSTIVWTVSDACNNQSTCSVSVTINENVLPTFTQMGPYCIGSTPVALPSTSTNGIAGTWNPASINTTTAGSSTYTFTPNTGVCAISTTMQINVVSISLTATPTSPACYGGNGSIAFSSTGGINPLTYRVNSVISTSPYTAIAGTYTVSVSDANGCTASTIVNVTDPLLLDAYFTATNVSCNGGSDGAIDVTVEGGVGSYTYHWADNPTSQDRTGLTLGTYNVTITDANSCSITLSIPITQPAVISITGNLSHVSCYNGSNGAVTTTTIGGTPTYTYAWTGGYNTSNINNVIAGTYIVTATDSRGCTGTASFTLNQPTIITINGTITHPTCNGLTNGGVDITPNDGTPGYTYQWNPTGANGTSQDLTGAEAGSYTVTVSDSRNCTMTSSYLLVEPTALTTTYDVMDMTCDSTNGSITLHPTDGTPTYTYLWGANASNAATASITHLTNDNYIVTITDSHLCSLVSTITVNRIIPPSILVSNVINETCSDTNASITIIVSDGRPDYHYTWSSNPNNDYPYINNISEGTHVVTVTDSDGCVDTAIVVITNHEAPIPSVNSITPAHCDQADGAASIAVEGGSGVYTYDWGVNPPRTSNSESGLHGTTYVVIISDSICDVPLTVVIPNLPGPTAIGSANPSAIGVDRANIRFTDNSEGATSWNWDFANGHHSAGQNPVFKYEIPGNYNVVLTVTDDYGCTDTDTILVQVFEGIEVWIPNGFSPNGDGLNDEFGPIASGYSNAGYEMLIYDRWGKQCFISNDYFTRWNGKIDGVKVDMNVVFVYRITIFDLLGKEYIYTGKISLIYSTD